MMSLRSRRIDAEWELLEKLAAANQPVIAHIEFHEEEFRVELRESPAWISSRAWISSNESLWTEREHLVRYVFPRYYPSLPLEAYMVQPVAHPNVDPENGFVCLWKSYRAAQTIVDAVITTRAVLSWSAVNSDAVHCMQNVQGLTLLAKPELTVPDDCRPMAHRPGAKQRLEASATDRVLQET